MRLIMNSNYTRRDWLKLSSLLALGLNFAPKKAKAASFHSLSGREQNVDKKPTQPLTAVVLGAGNRGNVYAAYSKKFPAELKIVGVAEPIELRRKKFSQLYNIPAKYQWVTWEHALQIPKFADVLIITTPDQLHYGPAMQGLALGYDLLLEKAIAQSWEQCNDILKLSRQQQLIVAICHVLRYTPYFRKLKAVMDSGALGTIVSVQHFEPVEHIHMSHSFVRGNWRNTKESNPMILSKSCHDLDILRWLINKPCVRLSSFGSLKYFKAENAPAGSTWRCTDGCQVENECPYSAIKIYLKRNDWVKSLRLENNNPETIMNALKEGPYGRCVFHCDNDVVDHQVVAMEFTEQITASFAMEAFTSYSGRRTSVMGTLGDAVGDMNTLTITDFRTNQKQVWDGRQAAKVESGHGGGDFGLMHDFIQAVSQQNPALLTSTIEASMESHLMGFKAEESRLSGKTVTI
ncbi:Gfo/Idh/MocA family oxidoreductase [candidate division KSB1 bacterium]|nr:Gfo/Idh/MocA family oxidoreductase [candidate division KSB1 bacterium]